MKKSKSSVIKIKFPLNYGFIRYPSISNSRISVIFTDKGLVNFYPFVYQYDVLLFDTSGSFVSPLPWLTNEKGSKKKLFAICIERKTSIWLIPTSCCYWTCGIQVYLGFFSGNHWWGLKKRGKKNRNSICIPTLVSVDYEFIYLVYFIYLTLIWDTGFQKARHYVNCIFIL